MMKTNVMTIDAFLPLVMKNSHFDQLLTNYFYFALLFSSIYVAIQQSLRAKEHSFGPKLSKIDGE